MERKAVGNKVIMDREDTRKQEEVNAYETR